MKTSIFRLQEFCYYANAIFLVMLLFYPRNEKLFMVCFSFAEVRNVSWFYLGHHDCFTFYYLNTQCWFWILLQGPLAWALIVWRCSLVFNSADKLVSVLIHLLPGELILSFCLILSCQLHLMYLREKRVVGKSLLFLPMEKHCLPNLTYTLPQYCKH